MRKHIDKIFLSGIAVALAATILSVMLVSYFDYRAYYEEATKEPERPPQTLLDDIDVQFVDGKTFYANNLARVTKDDLVVTAHYTLKTWDKEAPEGFTTEQYDETVAPEEYELSTPADFAFNGGDVTVSYKRKSKTINVSLVPVVPDRLEIVENPYTIIYEAGQPFDAEGLAVKVVYNDSSEKLLAEEDYTVDTETPLTLADTARTVTYSYGTDDEPATKTVDVNITVQGHVDNGDVVAMHNAAAVCYLAAGTRIADAEVDILGTYENGNRRLLAPEEYEVESEGDGDVLCLGKQYVLDVHAVSNESLSLRIPVHVRAHLEGEDATVLGGKILTEAEYTFENGEFTKGSNVSFAGSFSKEVNAGNEGSATLSVVSYTDCVTDITIHAGNSYCVSDSAGYWMKPLQINTIMDLTINDEIVPIPDTVVLKGCGPNKGDYAPLFGVYYDFVLPNVTLEAGLNVIKFTFKQSTLGEANCWGEKLSTINIDYINIDAVGTEFPESGTYTVTDIAIVDDFNVVYGTDFDKLDIKAVATLSDGARIVLDDDQITVQKPSGKAFLGTHEIKVSLVSDPQINDSRSYTFEEIKLEAENATYSKAVAVNGGSQKIYTETKDSYHATEGEKPELVAGDSVTAVRGLDWAATHWFNTYISFDFDANATLLDLYVSIDNGYYFENGTQAGGQYITKNYKFNEVLTLLVNGVEVNVPDSVVIEGYEYGWSAPDPIWLMFREVALPNIRTTEGANNITFRAKNTATLKNRWNEIPVPRFDYIRMEPSEKEDSATVTAIAPTPSAEVLAVSGTPWSEVKLPNVYATYSDGMTRLLSKSEYSINVPEGNVSEASKQLTVTYTALPSVTATITVKAITENDFTLEPEDIHKTAGEKGVIKEGHWDSLKETTVFTVKFYSPLAEKNHLWLHISNGNYQSGHFDEEQLNKVLAVKVNGKDLTIADSVKLQSWNDGDWNHFEWVDLGEIDITEGDNTIEISFKQEIKNSYNSYVTGNLQNLAVKKSNPGA